MLAAPPLRHVKWWGMLLHFFSFLGLVRLSYRRVNGESPATFSWSSIFVLLPFMPLFFGFYFCLNLCEARPSNRAYKYSISTDYYLFCPLLHEFRSCLINHAWRTLGFKSVMFVWYSTRLVRNVLNLVIWNTIFHNDYKVLHSDKRVLDQVFWDVITFGK
jgi:hypothetical protein